MSRKPWLVLFPWGPSILSAYTRAERSSGFGYGAKARKSMPGPHLALFSLHLREACPAAPGPRPLSTVSCHWPGPDQASVKGPRGSGQPPCWSRACVHAKWLHSCLILWDPMDGNPPGLLFIYFFFWSCIIHTVQLIFNPPSYSNLFFRDCLNVSGDFAHFTVTSIKW